MAEESNPNADVDISSRSNTGQQIIESCILENSAPLPFDPSASTKERIAALESALTRCIILGNGVDKISAPNPGATSLSDPSANSMYSLRPPFHGPQLPQDSIDIVLPDIVYLKMADFKAARPGPPYRNEHPQARLSNRSLHVIEVLQGDISHTAGGRDGTRKKAGSKPSLKAIPERVRVRSGNILRALEIISKGKMKLPHPRVISSEAPGEQGIGKEAPLSEVVFLRPFKLFVEFEHEIREYTESLKGRIESSISNSVSIIFNKIVSVSFLCPVIWFKHNMRH